MFPGGQFLTMIVYLRIRIFAKNKLRIVKKWKESLFLTSLRNTFLGIRKKEYSLTLQIQ
jgi:hypothetical protein